MLSQFISRQGKLVRKFGETETDAFVGVLDAIEWFEHHWSFCKNKTEFNKFWPQYLPKTQTFRIFNGILI